MLAYLSAGLWFLLHPFQVLVDLAQAIQHHGILFLQTVQLGLDTINPVGHAPFGRRIFAATGQQDQEKESEKLYHV